jgi:SET domain-containing protein
VDSGLFTFVNHGCKGTYNIGDVTDFDEFTITNTQVIPDELSGKSHQGTSTFNPVVDRHLTYIGFMNIRDIKAGEEILANYLTFYASEEDWSRGVIDLRNQCSGLASGEVTEYEQADQK